MKWGVVTLVCLTILPLQAAGASTVEELIAKCKSPIPAVREQAATELGELAAPTDAATAALIDLLEDGEYGSGSDDLGNPISWIARWSLERHGKAATPRLIARLTHDRPAARAAAAEMLGQLRDRRATAPLLMILNDPDDSVHHSAVAALGQIKDPAAFDALNTLLAGGPSRAAPVEVISAMASCNPTRARTALIRFVQHSDSAIREAAVSVMAERRDPRTIDALLAAIDDPDVNVQGAAALALEWVVPVRGPEPAVAAFAKKDAYQDVRVHALRALVAAGGPRTVEFAIEGLGDSSDEVQEAALWHLQHHPDVRALDSLLETLRTAKYNGVRADAAEALAALGDRAAVPGLIEALKDLSPLVRSDAAESLGELGDPAAVDALETLRNRDKNKGVRGAAALAIKRIRAAAKDAASR